jgi:hypothetical protein
MWWWGGGGVLGVFSLLKLNEYDIYLDSLDSVAAFFFFFLARCAASEPVAWFGFLSIYLLKGIYFR